MGAGGRPLKFETPEALQNACDSYFATEDHVTLSGLALHIGIDRRSLINYADRDEFFPIIKNARQKVEAHYEKLTIYSDRPTGVIFALKKHGMERFGQTGAYRRPQNYRTYPMG
jgi:hypothetical protein